MLLAVLLRAYEMLLPALNRFRGLLVGIKEIDILKLNEDERVKRDTF